MKKFISYIDKDYSKDWGRSLQKASPTVKKAMEGELRYWKRLVNERIINYTKVVKQGKDSLDNLKKAKDILSIYEEINKLITTVESTISNRRVIDQLLNSISSKYGGVYSLPSPNLEDYLS